MTHAEASIQHFTRYHASHCHSQPQVQQLPSGYVRLSCPRCREQLHLPLDAVRSAAAAKRSKREPA